MVEERRDLTELDPHVVTKRAAETDGEFVRFESTMHPAPAADTGLSHERWGVDFTREHVHLEQEEHIEVLAGEMQVVFEGEERTLTAGDEITFPPNTPHRHWNASDQPARIVWEMRPPLRTEEWAESAYAIAQTGTANDDGIPGLLQSAVLFDEYPDENPYLTMLPASVQLAFFSLLAPIARLAGYEATHTRQDIADR